MTSRKEAAIIEIIELNESNPDSLTNCSISCAGVACADCPVDYTDGAVTLGEIRKMDPREQPQKDTGGVSQGEDPQVRQPSHYQVFDGLESISVIARSMTAEQFKGFCLGNVLKYRLRAGKKSDQANVTKDLAKAEFYKELFEKHKAECYEAK